MVERLNAISYREPAEARRLRLPEILLLLCLVVTAGSMAPVAHGDDWFQFRGAERSGHSAEQGLARAWPEEGPPILWQRPLGEGFASLAIADGRLFTSFIADGQEVVAAFDVESGKELWRRDLGPGFEEFFGNGPRSTPTVDGSTVYALGSRGLLIAAAVDSGAVRWQVDLHQDFAITQSQTLTPVGATPPGPQLPVYGYAGSPLVVDDLLVVETGARGGSSFVAFDKSTGQSRWTALDTEIGYSSPTLVTLNGQRQILALPGSEIVSLSLQGDLLWSYPWAWTTSQPIVLGENRVFVSAENDVGAMVLQVDADGTTQEQWRSKRLKNAWNSSVLVDGYIYGFDNATLRCLDAATGQLQWAQRGLGKGNLLHADGLLFILTDKGKAVVAEANPQSFVARGSKQILSGRCWTPPALSGGVLYARNHDQLVALDVMPAADAAEAASEPSAEETP